VRSLRRCSCAHRGVDEVQKCAAPRGRKSRRKRLLYSVCVNRIGMADWSQCLETVIDHDVRDAPLRGAQHGRLFHHDYDRRVSAARCSRGVSCWSPCKAEVDYGEGAWEEIARRRQGPERGRTVEVRMGRGRGWFHTTLLRESGTASCRCLPRVEGLSHAIALSGHAAARPIPTERRRGSARFAGRGASRK